MFDPIRMCWVNRGGEEEDPFAEMDDDEDVVVYKGASSAVADDDEDWDEEGKGGTIRATLTHLAAGGAQTRRRPSGVSSGASSVEGSPQRSLHGRSASESDTESVPGTASLGRESSLSGTMMAIDEVGPAMDIPRALLDACRAAEERHRVEMRGWNLGPVSPSSRRTIATPIFVEPEVNHGYLYDIRTLATRKY